MSGELAAQMAAMGEQLAARLDHAAGVPCVGTDVQEIAPVAASVRNQGQRYLDRVYTAQEVRSAGRPAADPEVVAASLAGRFAVKESVLKVLHAPGAVPFTDIEVRRRDDGSVALVLTGAARRLAEQAGLHDWDVSISHDGGLAVAIVIALRHVNSAHG